jgi:ribosomal protein L20A (L18A)
MIADGRKKIMSVKTYEVSGFYQKNKAHQRFSTTVRGIKKEDVIEKVLSEVGGRFKVKRPMIKIEKLEEVKPEE